MASATPQTQYNSGCCFSIKHSDACHHIKETTLLITAAIATIAVVGGILAVLAMNGVNLGPLNSITNSFTTLIGEKYIYIGLTAATGLLLIDTVLIAALTRSYYNKQYTQKEIDRFGLSDWIIQEDILAKLEPGQYWRFPESAEKAIPATPTNPGRPAVWGCVVRNLDGSLGVYAFKTQEDLLAQISKIGYRNGEKQFNKSNEYMHSYVEVKIGRENYELFLQSIVNIGRGEYIKYNALEIGEEANAFPLLVNLTGQPELHFYKSVEARDTARMGLIKRSDIEDEIDDDEIKYLPQGGAWIFANPITVQKYNGEEEGEEVQLFVVASKKAGSDEVNHDCFPTLEAAQQFVQLHGYQDAKAAWNHPTQWPAQWVEENIELHTSGIALNQGEIFTFDLRQELNKEEVNVFALKIKYDANKPSACRYFKSAEARERYIQENLSNYIDPDVLDQKTREIKEVYQLNHLLRVPNVDCLATQVILHGIPHFVLIGLTDEGISLTDEGIKHKAFATAEEMQDFMGDSWKDIGGIFAAPGQFKSELVAGQVDERTLQQATELAQHLVNDQHDYGRFQTRNGVDVFWLASKRGEEAAEVRFFASERARASAIRQLGRSTDLVFVREINQAAQRYRNDQLLDYALTNVNDCWGVQIQVRGQRINVLYKQTDSGIEISYPKDLAAVKEGLNDIEARIRATGEYPTALGDYLNREGKIVKQDTLAENEQTMLPGEYVSWEWKPEKHSSGVAAYKDVYLLQTISKEGRYSVRYFATEKARTEAARTLRNGFVRDRDLKAYTQNLSKAINETSGKEPVPHVFFVQYEAAGRAAIVTVSADGKKARSEYVVLGKIDGKLGEKKDCVRLNDILARPSEEATLKALDKIETARLKALLGNTYKGDGLLKANQYALDVRIGYAMLAWVTDDEKHVHRAYFQTPQQAQEYVNNKLKGFTLVK